jgi:hypothetical protein
LTESDWALGLYTGSVLLAILGVVVSIQWWKEALNPPGASQDLKEDKTTVE